MQTDINVGHYASSGFANPLKNAKRSASTVQLKDSATLRMKRSRVLSTLIRDMCPHPMRFKQIWHMSRGGKQLYAWQPIAPEGYAALGMVCTPNDNPPAESSMHCVPIAWCCPSKRSPVKVWDDTGAGGGKPGSIWIINSLEMICVVPGHEPPKEQFYDIPSDSFFLNEV